MPESRDPRTSIVMITFNRSGELARTLRRLRALPEDPPIIVVDNGSTDATRSILERDFPEVTVIASGRNWGAAGRTLGVARANTPYVAFCDDDTWWEPGSLRRAADLMDEHPALAVLTARVVIGEESREDPVCALLAGSPLTMAPDLPGKPLLGFLAGASLVRRQAFLEVGGFEPRFFIGGEEGLLAMDLATRGWAMRYVPELLVHHFPSRVRDNPTRKRTLIRNQLWCAWLRRPWASAARGTWRTLVREVRVGIPWRAFLEALAGLPWVLTERRVVPRDVERALRMLDERGG